VDGIATIVGDVRFFIFHVTWIGLWIVLNMAFMPDALRFDPYPWEILRTVLPLEAILVACTVLMIQGRMKKQNQQRAHLELQIALLAEAEATKTLEMVRSGGVQLRDTHHTTASLGGDGLHVERGTLS
jgi:uncharacterized membrane protein